MERHPHNFTCPKCGQRSKEPYGYLDDCDDVDEDFESWEAYADLYYEQDYPGLVKYCEAEVARRPEDVSARCDLGQAYVLDKQYQKAIDLMIECHRQWPSDVCVQHIILDALFGLGKTEDDIAWVTVPTIIRLDAALIDNCYEYLRPKRNPRSVAELYGQQRFRGYLAFSCEDLMQALVDDDRFDLDADRGCHADQVKVRRKRRRNRSG